MQSEEFLSHFRAPQKCADGWMVFCPAHRDGETKGNRSLHLSWREDRWLLRCFNNCVVEDIIHAASLNMKDLFRESLSAMPPQAALRSVSKPATEKQIASWWDAGAAIEGTLAETYLRSRAIALDFAQLRSLRFLPAAPYYRDGQKQAAARYPCMVAAIMDFDGKVVGFHRTYLAVDGQGKAPEAKPKKTLAASLAGMRLSGRKPLIRIAEGIETVLSVATAKGLDSAQYVAVSAGMLPQWKIPPWCEKLEIYADADANGTSQKAAAELAINACVIGIKVSIFTPPRMGQDFNDILQNGGNAAVLGVEGTTPPQPTPQQVRAAQRRAIAAEAPVLVAEHYIKTKVDLSDGRILHHWGGQWWYWSGTHFVARSDVDQKAVLGNFLYDDVKLVDRNGSAIAPTSWHLNNTFEALRVRLNLSGEIKPPCWLDASAYSESVWIAVRNGLLELGTGRLCPPTPHWFALESVRADYDPDAVCPQWENFIGQLWEDRESQDALQEMFGYLITLDTSQQKAFMIIGPKRSGKGTIGRILESLIGSENVVRPPLASFGYQFGLEVLIGKSLAIISDARLDGSTPGGPLAETLLTITGEDGNTILRKYQVSWHGSLKTRFLILSNELPRFRDPSGALPARFIIWRTIKSFFGSEDLDLFDRLKTELSGILNWAIAGWVRLQERGRFVQPSIAVEYAVHLADIANPLETFIEDCCVIGNECDIDMTSLHKHYIEWCKESGQKPMPPTIFGRDLRTCCPELKFYRPHGQPRRVQGICPTYTKVAF